MNEFSVCVFFCAPIGMGFSGVTKISEFGVRAMVSIVVVVCPFEILVLPADAADTIPSESACWLVSVFSSDGFWVVMLSLLAVICPFSCIFPSFVSTILPAKISMLSAPG